MVSTLDREKHSFVGGEIGEYIKRLANESGRPLSLIRYNDIGSFCIIEFMSPNRDVFIDTMNLGKSLANFNRSKATELRQRLFKPLTCDDTSRIIADNESTYLHSRQDDNEEETERWNRIKHGE